MQEISRLLVILSLRDKKSQASVVRVFTEILSKFTQRYSDFVYTFLG